MSACFECGEPAAHDHHVIPRSVGGTKTVPLCAKCHGLVHGIRVAHPQLTKQALQKKIAIGERAGTVRRGYRLGGDGKSLVPDEAEQATVELILQLLDEGMTLRRIAAQLECRGVVTRKGKPFGFSAVGKIARQHGRGRAGGARL